MRRIRRQENSARAEGATRLAIETGLTRKQLRRSFSETGDPTLKATIAVMVSRRGKASREFRPDRMAEVDGPLTVVARQQL